MKNLKNIVFYFLVILIMGYFVSCKYEAPTEPTLSKQGVLVKGSITSAYLGGATKDYYVYKPADYDTADSLPVVYLLHGFGLDYTYFKDWTGIKHHLDELISNGTIKEMVVVMPDAKNDLAGSFYTKSYDIYHSTIVFGDYEDYLISELIPTVEATYSKIDTTRRAIGGISMGGYGAMYLAENHPSMFKTVFSHSGPIYFEVLKGVIPDVLSENPQGLTQTNLNLGISGPSPLRPLTSMMFAMSGAFDPLKTKNPAEFGSDTDARFILATTSDSPTNYLGVEIPFDPTSGTVNDTIFNTIWKANFDPSDTTRIANLNGLNIYFDAGNEDELGMNYCAIGFASTLSAVLPSQAYTYKTFTGGHTNKLYQRLEVSLKFVSDNF